MDLHWILTWWIIMFSIYNPFQQALHQVHVDLVQVHRSDGLQHRLLSVCINSKTKCQFMWITRKNCSSVYDTCCELTFVSDREFLQAQLLVWNGVFDKVLFTEGHEIPHVVTQVVHHVPWLSFASPAACGRRIQFPCAHIRAAILYDITGEK